MSAPARSWVLYLEAVSCVRNLKTGHAMLTMISKLSTVQSMGTGEITSERTQSMGEVGSLLCLLVDSARSAVYPTPSVGVPQHYFHSVQNGQTLQHKLYRPVRPVTELFRLNKVAVLFCDKRYHCYLYLTGKQSEVTSTLACLIQLGKRTVPRNYRASLHVSLGWTCLTGEGSGIEVAIHKLGSMSQPNWALQNESAKSRG